MTTTGPRFVPGEDVHPIQARLAFEDVANIQAVRLLAIDGDVVVLVTRSGERRLTGRRIANVADHLGRAIELPGGGWVAFWHEGKHLLAVPVGEPGAATPTQLGIVGSTVRLEGGAAVEALTTEPAWTARLCNLVELGDVQHGP